MERYKIFEPPFDYVEYIEKRLQEIGSLEEKKVTKTVLLDCLLRGIEETEKDYQRLEQRVYEEMEDDESRYGVAITVVDREDYDETSGSLFPVLESDARKKRVDMEEVCESMSEKRPCPLFPVYVEGDREQCRNLAREKRMLQGKLTTDKREYRAAYQLKKDERYTREVERLYGLFLENNVPWTTLNAGYLHKFFMIELRELDAPLERGERFESLHVEFEELGSFVREDAIPLWNIETIEFSSTDFAMPCINGINYEHEFPMKDYGLEDGYLIEQREELMSIRREKERLYIVTAKELFEKWTALRIVKNLGRLPQSYRRPVLSNGKRESFARRYANNKGARLQTKAEILRRANEFPTREFLRLEEVELLRGRLPEGAIDGEMNWFIQDELLDRESRKILLLRFKKEKEDRLNRDVMDFLVSELQIYFGEYRCMGVLE